MATRSSSTPVTSRVTGPQWDFVKGGFQHLPLQQRRTGRQALVPRPRTRITRLNVYAGLAGLYFVRHEWDTDRPGNPLGFPAFPYELAYAIQDRMFTDKGALFYPAFSGDSF